jgi:hypothetical protein
MSTKKMGRLVLASAILAWGAAAFAQENPPPVGQNVMLPYTLYSNAEDEGERLFAASGWMGNTEAIEFSDSFKENPHAGESCIRISFTDPAGWGGIVWQNPPNNWGDDGGGVNLSGTKQLSFWARGEKGGETVSFKMGLIKRDKPYFDTGTASLDRVKLTKEWKQYTMPLTGVNLSRIITPFSFSVSGAKEPLTFFLDDIVYQ